jgi:SAM-dependent methyltransferase
MLAEQLRPDVGQITLAEPSEGMREVLQRKVADGVLADAQVLDLDLVNDPPPEMTFEVIVSLMVLHHILDLDPVLAGLATLLRDGGELAVVDLDAEDGSFHDEGFDGHHGFDHDWLADRLVSAGFTTPRFSPCGTTNKHDRTYGLFLAHCRVNGHPDPRGHAG